MESYQVTLSEKFCKGIHRKVISFIHRAEKSDYGQ